MKKIRLILMVTMSIYACSLNAQFVWTPQVSNVTAELRGVYFTNSNHGVAVGAPTGIGLPSTIIRTDDAGNIWTPIITAFTDTLRAVCFTDDTTGFASGANGRILKTTDGGTVWDSVSTGVNSLLRTITFPTPLIGYAAGGGGVMIKTIDGGATWTTLTSGVTQDLINMRFANVDTGFAVSSNGTFTNGFIIKTTDGGATWTSVYTDPQGLLGLVVANADTIYAGGGSQVIVQSIDGGTTWTNQYTGNTGSNIRSGFFVNSTHGFMVGDVGAIFETKDAGVTWVNVGTQTNGNLGMHFPTADTGYVAGNLGNMLRYNPTCLPFLTAPAQIFGVDSICGKDSVSFYINTMPGANSYYWKVPPAATLYNQGDTLVWVKFNNIVGKISAAGVNQCGPGDSLETSVYLYPPTPPAPVSKNLDTLFSNVNAISYQWYVNGNIIPNATLSYYVFTANGNYSVLITDLNGCTSISIPYAVNNVGISEIYENEMYEVFPNPFTNYIEINVKNTKAVNAEINDLLGKVLVSVQLSSSTKNIISTNNLAGGIYLLKIFDTNKTQIGVEMILKK
ncbi:MAG TPA: YCF48-related protein [Bacteroidia bacterium]|nr:YCF48-related protein [Bacteroidia bacterium]